MESSPPQPESPPQVPPFTLLILTLVAVLFGSLIGSGIVYAISSARGIDLYEMLGALTAESPLETRNFVRLANLISHVFTFTIPVLVVVLLFFRRYWVRFLDLDRAPSNSDLLLGTFFILAGFPVAQTAYWINQQLPIPEWAQQMENSATGMLESLLVMNSPGELFFNLFVVAVLPAIGEEFLFRGMVQKNLERMFGKPHLAIWLTAIIFSTIHLQFEGFIPRMLLGAALGYLFYWTRNLWVPIAAHFVFNGMQVVAQYVAGEEAGALEMDEVQDPQWFLFLLGLLVIAGTGYALWKNNTPANITEHN